jgi:hypothetical protein
MRSVLAFVLLAGIAACHDDVEMFPIGPGTGGPGGGMTPDAAPPDSSSAGTQISGRVCLISDARTPTTCADSGAGNLTVTLGTETATTADNGSFSITSHGGTGLVWRVAGDAIVPSAMQVSTEHVIPAIGQQLYADMVAANNAIVGDGSGAIIARLTSGGSGVSGLVAATTPDPEGLIYYDGTSTLSFETNQTGSFGVVWVPGLLPQTTTLTLGGAKDATVAGIPVYASTVTFVLAAI